MALAATLPGQSFEKHGEPYVLMPADAKSAQGSLSEVTVDPDGFELGWRTHFGFFGPVREDSDTDGDGLSDAEEARQWTNPLSKAQESADLTPGQRRQVAMEQYRSASVQLDGELATPAQVLNREEAEGRALAVTLRASADAAAARAAAWSHRMGKPIRKAVPGQPASIVVDAVGDQPITIAAMGTVSNNFASIPPLWPGGVVGSNVTGFVGFQNGLPVRKICGLWDIDAPLLTHQELSGRVTIADGAGYGDGTAHATFVSGILAASGQVSAFRGAAYGAAVSAYNSQSNLAEVSARSNAVIKDMRASNHSYGPITGWEAPQKHAGKFWKSWSGDVAFGSGSTGWEDYRFGHYNAESAETDSVAANKAYHLLVKCAGDDSKEVGEGLSWLVIHNGVTQGYSWCYAFYNGATILLHYSGGGGFYVFESDVNYDYATGKAYLKANSTIKSLPGFDFLSPDGNTYNNHSGFDSISGGFGTAKNVLLVGSMDGHGLPSSSTASGPTDDGRLKPDVVALGGDTGVELTTVSVSFQPYYGGYTQCDVVFTSVMGGYYKIQYTPHGSPPNTWQDAPGVGIIKSRADLCYSTFYLSPSNAVPVRVIAVSPNPFNLP